MKLKPQDSLPIGTKVKTFRGEGIVEMVELEKDQHNNPIYVHHIKYADGRIRATNYSFINIITK